MVFTSAYSYADNREIKSINRDINKVSKKLSDDEKKAKKLLSQVRALEKKISVQVKKIYNIENALEDLAKRQVEAEEKQLTLISDLKLQQIALTEQLQALYSAGQQSHLKLLLKQEDPSDIGRTIKYFELINESRLAKIQKIKETQAQIQDLHVKNQADKLKLEALYETLKIEKLANARTLKSRSNALKQANNNVAYKRKKIRILRSRESRLQKKLALIEQNKRKLRQTSKLQRAVKKPSQVGRTMTTAKKKTGKLISVGGNQKFRDVSFSKQRGKLPWPVKGRLLNQYGAKKNEKRRWRGVLIKSPGGTRVRAIAGGTVSFAEYFEGYGYLVIIKHNNGYSSLYGNNQSLFVRKGQNIRSGHVIAAVGNTGGYAENALFFKIQKGRRAINPMRWLNK